MAIEIAAFLDANTYTAEQTRRTVYSPMLQRGATIGSVAGGVVGAGDFALSAPVSGMTINAAAGEAIVAGSTTGSQSGYYVRGSSTTATAVGAYTGTARVDLVCISVSDATYVGGGTGLATVVVVPGTPTGGATLGNLSGAPALPTSSLLLGYVLTNSNSGNVASNEILSEPPFLYYQLGKPYYLAYNSVATSIGNNTQVTLGGTVASGYGCTVAANNIVVPIPGIYSVSGAIGFASGANLKSVAIEQNGAPVIGSAPGATGAALAAGELACSANDTIGLWGSTVTPSTNTVNQAAFTYLHVIYQGPK